MKNLPTIDQKSTKNRSWGVLGRLGTEKVKRKGTPRVPVRHLGASWRLLGPSWSEKGSQHGSNLAPKTEPKSIKNRSQNRSIFACLSGSDFWRILMDFGRKMEPSWHPKTISASHFPLPLFPRGGVYPSPYPCVEMPPLKCVFRFWKSLFWRYRRSGVLASGALVAFNIDSGW